MKKIKFRIKGMNCQACAILIADELRETVGVEESVVNFSSNMARVVFDPQIVSKEELFKLIEELGDYQVVL
jgi:copper chaperone CopZ